MAEEYGTTPLKVLVLGSGNFGSCLADHLADIKNDVYLWSRSPDVVACLNATRRNPRYLRDHVFSENVTAVGPELPGAALLRSCRVYIWAVPTQSLRSVLEQVRGRLDGAVEAEGGAAAADEPLHVYVCKGLESDTQNLPIEIIAQTLGQKAARQAVFLSGPSFAKEIVARQPTQVSVASFSALHASRTAALFHQPHFRCYTNPDPVGVEFAGALKNVYAIASGCADGLGFRDNTRAGLVTRCLAEMTRVGVAFGAEPLTFLSLAGVGDLFLTCSSPSSRNYTVGLRLGKGEELSHILETLGSVAEGVDTAAAAHALLATLKVDAPIAEKVYEMVHGGRAAATVAKDLMCLPRMEEGGWDAASRLGQEGERAKRFRELVGLVR